MSDGQPAEPITPQEQLDAALERFAALNNTLPNGLPPFQLPQTVEMSSGMDALVDLLIEKEIIGEQEFIDRKKLRLAEVVDSLVDQAEQVKRQALGIILAAPGDLPARN